MFHPGFFHARDLGAKLEGALLLGQLEGSALGAGAVVGSRPAGAHLDGGQGTDALGVVVIGAAGDGALNAVVGVHLVFHGKNPPFLESGDSMDGSAGIYTS